MFKTQSFSLIGQVTPIHLGALPRIYGNKSKALFLYWLLFHEWLVYTNVKTFCRTKERFSRDSVLPFLRSFSKMPLGMKTQREIGLQIVIHIKLTHSFIGFWTFFETFLISEVPTSKDQHDGQYTILGYWSIRLARRCWKMVTVLGMTAGTWLQVRAVSLGSISWYVPLFPHALLVNLCTQWRSVSAVCYFVACEQSQASLKTQHSARCLACIRWLINVRWMNRLKMLLRSHLWMRHYVGSGDTFSFPRQSVYRCSTLVQRT